MERRRVLYVLAGINFTHIVDSMLIMPLGDLFIETFQINAAQFSLLVSVYAFAATLSALLAFFVLDRFDRKSALLLCYGGFSIGTLLCAFAPSYEVLILFRILTGLFGGVIGALALSIVSDLYLFKERGQAMGILMAAFSGASALGVPFGLYLAAQGSWHSPFLVLGGLAMCIWIFVALKFPSFTQHFESLKGVDRSMKSTIRQLTSDNNQINALAAGFVLVLAHFMIIPFISPYLIKNVGLSQEDIAFQFFLGGVATIVTSPLIGKLTDGFGVNKIFTLTMLLCFIPTMVIVYLQVSPLWYVLTFTTLFFVLASGRMIPANTMITASAGLENRGSFMAIKSALQQFAIGLSAIISGQIIFINQSGQYENYPIVGYIAVITGLISIFLIRRLKVVKGN